MKRIAFAVAVLLAAATSGAQVYEWKDEKGKTHFSDKPPPGSVRAQQIGASPASGASGSGSKTTADRELEYRKRQKDAQDKAEKDQKDRAANTERKESCEAARRLLATLESGERVALRDEQGERYYMDDAQLEQETAKARQLIQSACKP